jgi:hypothetical protein
MPVKYDKTTRKLLRKRIRELIRGQQKSRSEAFEILKNEFNNPDGSPLKESAFAFQCLAVGFRQRRPKHSTVPQFAPAIQPVPNAQSDENTLFELILDSNLDAEKKINLLKGLRK